MALLEVKIHPEMMKELIGMLRRIADGIDRAYPPGPTEEARKAMKPFGPEALLTFDPEQEYLRELEEEARNQ
jgi:hypothetical protein